MKPEFWVSFYSHYEDEERVESFTTQSSAEDFLREVERDVLLSLIECNFTPGM